MLSFNKEETHNVNLIKEKRAEGKFATTEVDTRILSGALAASLQLFTGKPVSSNIFIFRCAGHLKAAVGPLSSIKLVCFSSYSWNLGMESCKFGHWDLWGIEHTLCFAFLCQGIFGHLSFSLLPQGCALYVHSPSCSQTSPLRLLQFCVLSLRSASSKLFREISANALYYEWIILFSLSCSWMTTWTKCCKCCFKIYCILPVLTLSTVRKEK